MFGPVPTPNKPKEPARCEIDNLTLFVDVIKKTEISKDDVIIVKIKSTAMGINSTVVERVMEENFPGFKVLIIDDTLDIEFVKTTK